MITGINHITFATSDIEKSLGFYCDFLNFNLIAKWDNGAYLSTNDVWLCLIYDKKTKTQMHEEYTHIAFSVDPPTFKVFYDAASNIDIHKWKDNTSEGESLYLLDPDFNKIEIHCGNLYTRIAAVMQHPYAGMEIYLDNNQITQNMEKRIKISTPLISDMETFLNKVNASKSFHSPWVNPPANQEEYKKYLQRISKEDQYGYFLRLHTTNEIIGVINISEIVRGGFQSAYLGYYLFKQYSGKGFMREGLHLIIQHAFNDLGLHRLEANIQPNNTSSIKLVKSIGFIHEGFSPQYLRINNSWCDHERFAIIKADSADF